MTNEVKAALEQLAQKVSDEYADAQRCGCDANGAWDCAMGELRKQVQAISSELAALPEQRMTLKDAVPIVVKELRCAAARIGDAGMVNEAVQYGLLAREIDRILGDRK